LPRVGRYRIKKAGEGKGMYVIAIKPERKVGVKDNAGLLSQSKHDMQGMAMLKI
jgi:hypothetical protein